MAVAVQAATIVAADTSIGVAARRQPAPLRHAAIAWVARHAAATTTATCLYNDASAKSAPMQTPRNTPGNGPEDVSSANAQISAALMKASVFGWFACRAISAETIDQKTAASAPTAAPPTALPAAYTPKSVTVATANPSRYVCAGPA